MQYAFYNRYQFIDQNVLNAEQTQLITGFSMVGAALRTPGLANAGSMTLTPSALIVNVGLPAPFGVQFSGGVYAQAHGTTNGTDSPNYSLNFAGSVPASGTSTVYVVAQAATVNETPVEIVGPPPGHPDYDPTFTPATGYTALYDTLNLVLTTVVPNNTTNIELFRTTLTAGQTAITGGQLIIANQVAAGNMVTFANVVAGLGYTPVNKAGDTMTGSLFWSATQSGGASASPFTEWLAWTGAAAISHRASESSGGSLIFANSTNSTTAQLDQNSNFYLESIQSGAAVNAPSLFLYAWSGTANVKNALNLTSGGVFTLTNTAGTAKFTSDNNSNFTSAGGLASIFNTQDDGTGNASVKGILTLNSSSTAAATAIVIDIATNSFAQILFPASGGSTDTNAVEWYRQNSTSIAFAVQAGATNVLVVKSTGSVASKNSTFDDASGNSTFNGNMQINGTVTSTGVGNFNTSSLQFKENVSGLRLNVANFMAIKPITYTHIASKEVTDGFSAENIYDIYPELVQLRDNKPFALNYSGIIPHTVLMLQHHHRVIESLREEVERLQDEIRGMRNGIRH